MIGNRNIRRGLMAVLMAVAMVFPLAGCGNEGDFTADECRIKLHDGRTVTCINFDTYKGGGGLSCDWDNASGKDVETK